MPLNLDDQSRPIELEIRWPIGQIRLLRANGPVLTACLRNVKLLVTVTIKSVNKCSYCGVQWGCQMGQNEFETQSAQNHYHH